MLALPPRLWRAQLRRLGLLSLAVFVLTAIGADGVPPVTQARRNTPGRQGIAREPRRSTPICLPGKAPWDPAWHPCL